MPRLPTSFFAFLFLTLNSWASNNICELRLLIENGVLLKISLGEKARLTIEPIVATTEKVAAPGFFQRLKNLGEGLGDISRLTAIQSAITQIRKEESPARHKDLLDAMAAYFSSEGITNIQVKKDPQSGAYTYYFPDLPPNVTSPSRWLADLNTFLRAASPSQPTVAYISSDEGLGQVSRFNRDLLTGETSLSLSEFPSIGQGLYPSTNTAHELFHWVNDWMQGRPESQLEAWPQHQILLGRDKLEVLKPEMLSLNPTPLIDSRRQLIFQHYVEKGFLVEEVGAYAFQTWLEGAVTQELSKGLDLKSGQGGLKALRNFAEFESRHLFARAYETLRTYDFHLAFAEVSLVAYATFIKQAAQGGFAISIIEDQMIEIELRGGTKIRLYYKKGARERKALFDRDPPKLLTELMLAAVRIVDESNRLQAALPLLARQILPIFEYYLARNGDKTISEIIPIEGEGVKLSSLIGFAREQALKAPAAEAIAGQPYYVFPVWRPQQ